MVMIYMRERGNVPTWVVYSLQMLMDAREEFGNHLNHAQNDTVETADWIGTELDLLLAKCPSVMAKKEIHGFRDVLRHARDETDCSRYMEGMSLQLAKKHLNVEDRKLYRNVPLMGGARAQLWLQQYHEISTNYSSHSGSILDVAHLGNAAHQSKMLSATLRIPNLDTIIDLQGEACLFFGERAIQRKEVAARHLYARGMSVRTAASDRRTTKKSPTAKRREFKPLSDYVEATIELEKGVLHSSVVLHSVRACSEAVVKLYLDRLQGKITSDQRRDLPPLVMLQYCTQAFGEDALFIRMNSMAFSRKCEELLCRIRAMCKEVAPGVYRKNLLSKDEDLSDFLGAVFAMPYTNEERKEWPQACEMLRECIEEHGDEEVEKARLRLGIRDVTSAAGSVKGDEN
jgi:hypothetical protein